MEEYLAKASIGFIIAIVSSLLTTKTALTNLRNKPKLDWNTNPALDIFETDYNCYKEALDKIVKASKKDLKV